MVVKVVLLMWMLYVGAMDLDVVGGGNIGNRSNVRSMGHDTRDPIAQIKCTTPIYGYIGRVYVHPMEGNLYLA